MRQVKERGWAGTITQLYTIGDVKFGVLKGTDRFGNKYYEDLDQPFGQHRWVEFSNIHDPDATMIQPEWHGWMHHMFDETPEEMDKLEQEMLATTQGSNAIFNTHMGHVEQAKMREQVDTSQYRQRGYKVGSRMTKEDEPDDYYLQPGHPLSKEDGRFENRKESREWTPNS